MNGREQHLKQVNELIKTFADPYDGIIYHYTPAKGFQGIIESGEIWLTNTDFVNDTIECNALQKEADLFGKGEFSFNRYVEKWWQNFLKYKDKRNTYYITSFSKKPDSLEQWRAYGNICIGFEAQRLKKSGFYLYECVYSKEEIKSWILEKAKAKEWMLSEPDRTRKFISKGGVLTTSHEDGRDGAAFSLIFNASIKLKHVCYRNEKEVRLLAVSHHDWGRYPDSPSMYEKDPPIHFRLHPAFEVLVPYVRFFIPAQPEEECDSIENYEGKTELQIKEEKREKEKNRNENFCQFKKYGLAQHRTRKRRDLPAKFSCERRDIKMFK